MKTVFVYDMCVGGVLTDRSVAAEVGRRARGRRVPAPAAAALRLGAPARRLPGQGQQAAPGRCAATASPVTAHNQCPFPSHSPSLL